MLLLMPPLLQYLTRSVPAILSNCAISTIHRPFGMDPNPSSNSHAVAETTSESTSSKDCLRLTITRDQWPIKTVEIGSVIIEELCVNDDDFFLCDEKLKTFEDRLLLLCGQFAIFEIECIEAREVDCRNIRICHPSALCLCRTFRDFYSRFSIEGEI
jgi:hypothetical protein